MAARAVAALAALALCLVAGANPVYINAGGNELVNIGWRCDTGKFATPGSIKYTTSRPTLATGGWKDVYKSHRWIASGDLEYKIPVQDGSHTVFLMFSETWSGSGLGVREFNVKINGVLQSNPKFNGKLDVFKVAGGLDKPFFLNAGLKPAVNGFITITLERIPGKNNPFISGIVLNSASSDALVGNEGVGSCAASSTDTPAPSPSSPASSSPVSSASPSVSGAGPSASASASASAGSSPSASASSSLPPTVSTSPVPEVTPPATGARCSVAKTVTGMLQGGGAFVMNVGGLAVPQIGWGSDNINYIVEDNIGKTATAPQPVPVTGSSWVAPFQSHRYTFGKSLTYRIPVPNGVYTVALLHAESYMNAVGQRTFDIDINGVSKAKAYDVFKLAGKNKPLYKGFGGIQVVDGFLTIKLKKVVENPFVNGIYIVGPGAGTLAVGGPEDGVCAPGNIETPKPSQPVPSNPIVTPVPSDPTVSPTPSNPSVSPVPSVPSICDGKAADTTFTDVHFAHAVSGGPYVETDFQKKGYAQVTLDGANSHSHFQKGDEPGKIVKFQWVWQDPKNPLADANGTVTVESLKTTQNFPLGITTVTLVVADQFCNPASETTTVTVNSATLPGAYCYYYDFGSQNLATVPLPLSPKADPKPMKGLSVGDINFANTDSFGEFPFKANTFAVRCIFYIDVKTAGPIQYKVLHSGPVKIYHAGALMGSSDSMKANQMELTTKKTFSAGLQEWQILYLRPKALAGKLVFQFANGAVIPQSTVRHDSGTTLPVITGMSSTTGFEDEFLLIFGTAFVNGVKVKFGTEEAQTIETTAGVIQVRAPAGTGIVDVTVTTQAGVSNGLKFTYSDPPACPLPKFTNATLSNTDGTPFELKLIAVVKYGPDGRLYAGALNSKLYALTINKNLQVTQTCMLPVFEKWGRAVLGLGFDPSSSALKLFFTTSTIYWKEYNIISKKNEPVNENDFIGWTNGKVKSVTMKGPNGCFNNDVADVVTGLPVSNHDHAVQSIQFLPGGRMILSVGGFTNGGISLPNDLLGGFGSNPLAGALVECPTSGTNIEYTDKNPEKAQIKNPANATCKTYATGFRNSYGVELHTNGRVYATDNGPNKGYGEFTTDCIGIVQKPSKNIGDKLILVEPGRCHGHPSLNRGRNGSPEECAFEDDRCVKPLIAGLQSSTNGVMEYKSNTFCDKLRGNLFMSKFSGDKGGGRVNRVILDADGQVAANGFTNQFWGESGLALVESPRGEMIMSRVYKDTFFVLKPVYQRPSTTFFISVMPRQGPAAGGNKVLVTGHNFGTTPSAKFGSKDCTNATSIDDDSFTCIIPPGTSGQQVTVTVTGTTGISTGVGVDYWYF